MAQVLCAHCHWYGGLVPGQDAMMITCDHPHAWCELVTPLARTTVRVSGNVRNAQNDCADFEAPRVAAYLVRQYGPILALLAAIWGLWWLLLHMGGPIF